MSATAELPARSAELPTTPRTHTTPKMTNSCTENADGCLICNIDKTACAACDSEKGYKYEAGGPCKYKCAPTLYGCDTCNEDFTVCNKCDAYNGYVTDGARGCMHNCLTATPQCAICTAADTCAKCKTGYKEAACDACDDGYEKTSAENDPLVCGQISCDGKSNCTLCSTSECLQCAEDYKLAGTAGARTCELDCPTLIPNCAECSSSTECTKCNTGFTGTTCNSCDTGYTGSNCANCAEGYAKAPSSEICGEIACNDLNCKLCITADNCKTCDDGYKTTGKEGSKTCVKITCKDTITKCETCKTDNSNTCDKCKAGYKLPNCDTCDDGFNDTATSGLCVPNSTDCAVNNCETCKDGTTNECVKCTDKFYLDNTSASTVCVACKTGCATCENGTECLTCDTGYTADSENAKICKLKCTVPNCGECKPGTADDCKTCNDKYYPVTGETTTKCAACDASCATCSEADKCTKCADGYADKNNDGVCVSTCTVENCATCESDNADSCKTCSSGYALTGEENKKTCMPDCLKAVKGCAVCKSATVCEVCSDAAVKPDSKGACAKGLSAGAIAGITIAVVVAAGGIAAGAYFAVRALKTKKSISDSQNTVQVVDQHPVLAAESDVK